MITHVKELHKTIERPDGRFYNYLICRAVSGRQGRYHVLRIDEVCENMERLGCELPLEDCRRIIAEQEPLGTEVVKHGVLR